MADLITLEESCQKILEGGLQKLRTDIHELNELDSFFEGHINKDLLRFKSWLKSNDPKIIQGFPMPGSSLYSCYSVLPASGSEKEDRGAFSDLLGWKTRISESDDVGNPKQIKIQYKRGIDWESTVNVSSWSLNGELTLMLHSLARKLLFEDKSLVLAAQNLKFAEETFQISMDQYPEIPFIRILSVSTDYTMSFDQKEENAYLRNKISFSGSFE